MRVLISTYGFDESKVIAMMSKLAYDKLVLVAGDDVLRMESYLRLERMESLGPNSMETIAVDVKDFRDCLEKVNDAIRTWNVDGNEVILNISGGTVVLADAALLAGYHNGVEMYHVEEKTTRLPIIRGMKVRDRFTESQVLLIKALREGDSIPRLTERLRDAGMDEGTVRREIHVLTKRGVISQRLVDGKIRLRFAEGQELLRHFL